MIGPILIDSWNLKQHGQCVLLVLGGLTDGLGGVVEGRHCRVWGFRRVARHI